MRIGVHRVGTTAPSATGEQVDVSQARQAATAKRSGKQILRGVILVFIAGTLWGFSGACGQLLSQVYDVPVRWVLTQRLMWSGLFFLLGGLLFDRANIKRLISTRKQRLQLLVYAIFGLICCQWFYLEAIATSNAGTATLMEQLGLILVLLITCVRDRRNPHKLEMVGLVLALIGVFFVSTHGNPNTLVLTPEGLAWGIAAAFGAMFYIVLPVPLLEHSGSFTVTSVAMVVAAIVAIPVFQPWTYQVDLTLEIVLATAGMIVFGTILSYLCFMQGVRDTGPVLAGLLNTVELVAAFVFTHFWLGTTVAVWDILGCACIMVMMCMMALGSAKSSDSFEPDNRKPEPPQE